MESSVQTKKIIAVEGIKKAYDDMIYTISTDFDKRIAFITEICVSVVATLMLDDIYNPVGLILVDYPSTGKTTVLSLLYNLPMVYRSDNFTPQAFVSHAANRTKKTLQDNDLLRQIQYKCLVVPELSPIFGQKPDDLQKSIAILTRIFDGEGYISNSGSHGRRGYEGDYLFSMLGATTPIKKKTWKTMGQFGSRLLFLTLNSPASPQERTDKAVVDLLLTGRKNFKQKLTECKAAVLSLFDSLKSNYYQEDFHRSISWNETNDPHDLRLQIIKLAEFTARARSLISIWETKNRDRESKYDFAQLSIEGPHRLAAVLYSLARGHAIIQGRESINEDDMAIVAEVALSSMQDDRRQVINLLLDDPGKNKSSPRGVVTSVEIEKSLPTSRPTADKVMEEHKSLNIGKQLTGMGNQPSTLSLTPDDEWLTHDIFAGYRHKWRELYPSAE